MSQVYNNFYIKTLPFVTIDEVNNFRRMTRTSQAEYLANQINSNMKIVSKHEIFYFNINNKLWVLISEIEYLNFITKLFNETIVLIIQMKRNTIDLAEDLNKELVKLCGLFDNMTYIKDIIERLYSNLYDKDFRIKLDDSRDQLPIKDGLKINLKTLEITEITINDFFFF
jgi:hypothetical protein